MTRNPLKEYLRTKSEVDLFCPDLSSNEYLKNPNKIASSIIEDIKAPLLDILNEHNKFSINEKIDFLESFKNSTLEHIEDLKRNSYAETNINKFILYVEWLDRQLAVLRNNGTYIVE
jgi:hypothetical protein